MLPSTGLYEAHLIAEHVRSQIELLKVAAIDGGDPIRVTVSAGVSSLAECARDDHSLMATADAALLEAKRAGNKNQTACALRRV